MKDQLQTIRAGLETATCYTMLGVDAHSVQTALTALTQLEATAGEPVYWQWRRKGHDWTLEYTFANEVQVTTEDSERRALYATPPAQQPQAEAVQACGHPMSLLLRSAESNEPLYCEACDDKSGRHDAERRETELLDVKRHLQEKIASADALKLHAIEELCQLGYTVKDGELIPPDHLHKLVEAAGHPLTAPQQAEAVPLQVFESDRAKTLMKSWQEGWDACRDSEYVGEDAQNDAFNRSETVNRCVAEDMLAAPQQAEKPKAELQPQSDISEFLRSERECWEEREPKPQAEAVHYTRAELDRAYSAGLVEGERLAIQQAEAVPSDVVRDAPPGYVLVPVEPTQAMIDAMQSSGWMPANYRAMIAAAQGEKP